MNKHSIWVFILLFVALFDCLGYCESEKPDNPVWEDDRYYGVEYIGGDCYRTAKKDSWLIWLVNSRGDLLSSMGYSYIYFAHEGIMLAEGRNGYDYLALDGSLVGEGGWEACQMYFSEKRAWVAVNIKSENNSWKSLYIDSEGNYISDDMWDHASPFHNECAVVGLRQADQMHYGFIDKYGTIIQEPCWDYLSDFASDGVAVAGRLNENDEMQYAYINTSGVLLTDFIWKYANPFAEGRATAFNEKEGWCILDKAGAITAHFDGVMEEFSDGFCAVHIRDANTGDWLCGFVNFDGEIAIKAKYAECDKFINGFACVKDLSSNMYGAINKNGEYVVEPKYCEITNCGEGLFVCSSSTPENPGYVSIFNLQTHACAELTGIEVYHFYNKQKNHFVGLMYETGEYCFINNNGDIVQENAILDDDDRYLMQEKDSSYMWK